jgi:NAD(P)-dependent dehydrogenase (short-subunit alcohol dehydrogenase family)
MSVPLSDLSGRTALVTGASDGIGREVARGLAARGAHVILACRNEARAEAARAAIARSTGSRALEVQLVDFSRPAQIRAFARAVREAHPALHVLVNNAGGWSSSRRETAEGLERTWATNMLGYFLTTELLRPLLLAGAPARIVNVASLLAYGLDLSDTGFTRRRYDGIAAYAQSKQANRQWTWALARRLEGSGVTANAMHPGTVNTGIYRKNGGLRGAAATLWEVFHGRTPAEGADTVLWLAASPEASGGNGLFFIDRQERECEFRNRDEEERLWAACEAMAATV